MKKTICIVMCFVFVFAFGGCSENKDVIFPESGNSCYSAIPENGTYAKRTADWEIYNNAKELISAADLVFIGKITGIEFQILDITNALPVSESTAESDKELYTVYSVDVVTPLKGNSSDVSKVRMMGGMVDYKVDEQLKVMNDGESFHRELGIPIWDEFYKTQCENGQYYLFALKQFETGYPTILNLAQSVYHMDEPTRKNTIGNTAQVYYSGSEDENGTPMISAYDIISEFGSKELESFCQNWKAGKYRSNE